MKRISTQAILALWACKFTKFILKTLRRRGTTLPGRIGLRICPNLPHLLAQDITIIAVSGTNGKSTTCHMLMSAFEQEKRECFSNQSGANLLPGITTALAHNANLWGRPTKHCAVIECDELTAEKAFSMLQPKMIILTNLYRDQLDRCGEITHVQNVLLSAIRQVPEAELCLNADDPLLYSIASQIPNRTAWYGVKYTTENEDVGNLNDARYCPHCKVPYQYHYRTFAQLGKWCCSSCGEKSPELDVFVELLQENSDSIKLLLHFGKQNLPVLLPIPGGYNAYNAAAAAAALIHLGFSEECTALSLKHFSAVFGRGEHFPIGGGTTMILIKNPAGCDRALHYLSYIKAPFSLVLILNDLEADGTDISWIWDANYEILNSLTNLESITVSGTRAEDLLIRLKYAGLNSDHISLIHENSRIIRNITASETSTVVLPTDTAMCAFRPMLTKISGVSAFGE